MSTTAKNKNSYFTSQVQAERNIVGGKAAGLLALSKNDFCVPPFVVLAADCDSNPDWSALIEELTEITTDWPGSHLAVRSSAIDEDASGHSFAGQFDTVLGVQTAEIEQAVKQVWQSANHERVLQYRKEHNLTAQASKPAVIIQALIPAEVAGVAFSKDPLDPKSSHCLISAVYGLGESLVDGSEDSSVYKVDAGKIVDQQTAQQHHAKILNDGKVTTVAVSDAQNQSSPISPGQAAEIATLCQQAEQHFGAPQDIEWAIADDQIWLLQSRNITTLNTEANGEFQLWDNSNIAESYSGITTPLTFSFARYVYEGVYRQFAQILGVSRQRITSEDQALRSMLGLHAGRIYYNMNSWYRVLAFLPGFQFNRQLMEQMMGVKEGLPDELAAALNKSTWLEKVTDGFNLLGTLAKLCWLNIRLGKTIRSFLSRFESALRKTENVETQTLEDSIKAYLTLESRLLSSWDAPLINDFFAMIFVGVLAKLCESWLDDGNIHSALLSADGDIISTEPARRITQMADLIRDKDDWISCLASGDNNLIANRLTEYPELQQQISAYLDKFSDRCLGELKLESLTLKDDPSTLYASIAAQATMPVNRAKPHRVDIDKLIEPLKKSRQKVFLWVLKQARARVRDRENLRFERTRLFGRVRALMLNIGQQLTQQQQLHEPRDIFYLCIEEIVGLNNATSSSNNLKGLVELRKAEFERYDGIEIPDRFETRGPTFTAKKQTRMVAPESSDKFEGTGACPGIVEAHVCVVTDPSNARMKQGEILVAQQTDPGWVMLFPMASGLLVERGSLLSHSAIVARELNIPAVVSIPGLLAQLKTGDRVMMNGQTGEVWKLGDEQPPENNDEPSAENNDCENQEKP